MSNITSIRTVPGTTFRDKQIVTPDDLNAAIDDIECEVGENAITHRELDPMFFGTYVEVVDSLGAATSYAWDTSGSPSRFVNVLEIWPEQSPFTLSISDTSNGRLFVVIVRLASGTISFGFPSSYKRRSLPSHGSGSPYTTVGNYSVFKIVTHNVVTVTPYIIGDYSVI